MANNRNIELDEVVKLASGSTLKLTGETGHSSKEAKNMMSDFVRLMEHVKVSGDIRLVGSKHRIRGSNSSKGLSVTGVKDNHIQLAYQPNGNDSRHQYVAYFDGEINIISVYADLRKLLEADFLNAETAEKADNRTAETPPVSDTSKSVAETKEKVEQKNIQYGSNQEWVDDIVLKLDLLAEKTAGVISKAAFNQVIVENTHFENAFGIGPIILSLRHRGHIESVGEESYRIILDPKAAVAPVEEKVLSIHSAAPVAIVETRPILSLKPATVDVERPRRVTFPRFARPILNEPKACVEFLREIREPISIEVFHKMIQSRLGKLNPDMLEHVTKYMIQQEYVAIVDGTVKLWSEGRYLTGVSTNQESVPVVSAESSQQLLEAIDAALAKAKDWKKRAEKFQSELAESKQAIDTLKREKSVLEERVKELEKAVGKANSNDKALLERIKQLKEL